MNRTEFVVEQNSPENIKARADAIKTMTSLISAQSQLCKMYNLQKQTRL